MNKVKIINTNTAQNIQKREEDWETIGIIENLFREKRGYVIRIPEKATPVIACMSGGLDSTANTAILLEEFGLEVYPFFINRGQSNIEWEKKALQWYDNFFQKRYELYHPVKEIHIETPPKDYKPLLRATKHLTDNLALRKRNTYPARNPTMFLAGMEYGYSLQSQGVFPKTLFIAEHGDDTSVHGSLTLMRITNLMFCWLLGDWDWQFISLPIERELGNHWGKDVYVKWCSEHNIPLEHTRTCCNKSEIQCGVCQMACWDRRMAFKKAGVEDKTEYANPMPKDYQKAKVDSKENWRGKDNY